MRLHISDAKPIIAEMLEDTSLRSFSCHAEESPEHLYVFFTMQTSSSFSNICLQASSFKENIEIFKIVKFPLFQKRSKRGEWLKTYFNYSIYDISFLNREFLKTNWCIFQSAASCPKTVPPLKQFNTATRNDNNKQRQGNSFNGNYEHSGRNDGFRTTEANSERKYRHQSNMYGHQDNEFRQHRQNRY